MTSTPFHNALITWPKGILCSIICLCVYACSSDIDAPVEAGVSSELATQRAEFISNLSYELTLNIPEEKTVMISASIIIQFELSSGKGDLILDFNAPESKVHTIKSNDKGIKFRREKEHIIISSKDLSQRNSLQIDFEAGNLSLNRHDDYLYTLFVPDRAATCFPLFDQPDLKATYKINLNVPEGWAAVSNAKLEQKGNSYTSAMTKPISSYLFSFAAGKFEKVTREINGQEMNLYHRETDSAKVENNVEEIFRWHQLSLEWLEEYTGIPYSFDKFDFVLIPSFQYGGMEHPGSIFYKASSLFLDETSTLNQQMGRARLIAHEVSHMWFGNLVTMKWFDDVWLKEVFANFMAAKIVHPNYPEINHDLQFLMSHYPSAYAVDRTKGNHPIQQYLDNLKNAGSLYGAIIYQKAPITMRMLEDAIGQDKFRENIQTYLNNHKFGNATWDDLISIMSQSADFDINQWNKNWIKSNHMPAYSYSIKQDNDGLISEFEIESKDFNNNKIIWGKQDLMMLLGDADSMEIVKAPFLTNGSSFDVVGRKHPDRLFMNGDGRGYGFFRMDEKSRNYYLANINSIPSPVLRGALWINLYESMLRKRMSPTKLMRKVLESVTVEKEELIIEYLNSTIRAIFWKFYSDKQRKQLAPKLEGVLLNMAVNTQSKNLKASFFNTLMNITSTEHGAKLLLSFYNRDTEVDGLKLSERDFTRLAYELAVREVDGYEEILNRQLQSMTNPDRKKRMEFVLPALSHKTSDRDAFFESLKNPANRENEEWVLEAIRYLHHPLRAKGAVKYIRPSLEILEEIKLTGDIFFPGRWLQVTFGGHQSEDAANEARQFINRNDPYPKDLNNKILQATDLLFRSVDILEGERKISTEIVK